MEIKYASELILILVIASSSVSAQIGKEIYIKAEESEVIILDENFLTKTETKNTVIFSFGVETLGEINEFIYNKNLDLKKEINIKEFNLLNFSTIEELNKELIITKKWKHPNQVFRCLFIVEKNQNSMYIYEVRWKKVLFIE